MEVTCTVWVHGFETFEHDVGSFEVHAALAAHDNMSDGGGEEGFADADGSEDDGVVGCVEEPQGAELASVRS